MKSPPAIHPLMAPTASICPGDVGRITAHLGRLELIDSHGTAQIRLVSSRGFTVISKFGNAGSPFAAASGATGGCTEFPEKSTHSRKWHTSSAPILRVIFRTSGLETFWLKVAYRLEPACSINPK